MNMGMYAPSCVMRRATAVLFIGSSLWMLPFSRANDNNPCLETGTWSPCNEQCEPGSIARAYWLPSGNLFYACVGETFVPPKITVVTTDGKIACNDGVNTLICSNSPYFGQNPNQTDQTVPYIGTGDFEPPIPASFSMSGLYDFVGKAKASPAFGSCPDIYPQTIDTLTVKALLFAFKHPAVPACWSSNGIYEAAGNLTYDSYDTNAMGWTLQTLDGDPATAIDWAGGKVHFGDSGGRYSIRAQSTEAPSCGADMDLTVLKVDIEQAETFHCFCDASTNLNLTSDSFVPGGVVWSIEPPSGLSPGSGNGNTFTYDPGVSTPGTYVVTARSADLSSCSDEATIRVLGIEVELDDVQDGTLCICSKGNCEAPISVTLTPSQLSGDLTVQLLDEGGTAVKTLFTAPNQSGQVPVSWNLSGLEPGTYSIGAVWAAGSAVCTNQSDPVLAFQLGNISIEDDKFPVKPGETAHAEIEVLPDSTNRTIKWSIVDSTPKDPAAPILATIDEDSGLVVADPNSGSGLIKIRAADSVYYADCYREAELYIGCLSCAAGSCSLVGQGFADLGSVDFRIGLGPSETGHPAGDLYVRTNALTPAIYTPAALQASLLDPNARERYQDGVLRQVRTTRTLVDILTQSDHAYSVVFYSADAVTGTNANHLELIDPAAIPIKTWNILNPDPGTLQHLVAEEVVGSQVDRYEYDWNSAANSWALSRKGLQKETLNVTTSGTQRVETRQILGPDNAPVSIVRQTFQIDTFGERVVREVVDPDGANLVTVFEYVTTVTNRGRQSRITRPDGSWVRYLYDGTGRLTNETRSWLDAPSNAVATAAREIRYYYESVPGAQDAQLPEDVHRPRTVSEFITNRLVSRTYSVYGTNAAGGRTEITERASATNFLFGHAQNLRTVRDFYPVAKGHPASGKVKSVLNPDGRLESYEYQSGTYLANPAPGSFSVGEGTDRMDIVTHGTAAQPDGIPFKTTRSISIFNARNEALMQANEVRTETGFDRLDWTLNAYDDWGRELSATHSNGERTETTWDCCGASARTDAQGNETLYGYDALKRVIREERNGIVRSNVYDAAGRVLLENTAAGGLVLTASNRYDRAGRLLVSVDAAHLVTSNAYSSNGRTNTQTMPGGATRITTQFADGSTRSITGTAGPEQHYTYGVNADGSQWTLVRTGATNSPMWERTTTDVLGRAIRTERPGFGGGTVTNFNEYNALGQLSRTWTTGITPLPPATLYVYDELGQSFRVAQDLDADGQIDLDTDRVVESDAFYHTDASGHWYRVATRLAYPYENSSIAVTTGVQTVRLTGLGVPGPYGLLTAETISTDAHGQETIQRTYTDRENKTVVQSVSSPQSIQDQVSTTVAGLLVGQVSASGVTNHYEYDALGRSTNVVTVSANGSRQTGQAMVYNALGQVESEANAATNVTTFAYDPVTGQRTVTTDALSNTVYNAYDLQGRVTNTWGATTPVAYKYDKYGRMTNMMTWRDTNGTPDVTRWFYDEATGLLTNKLYADNKGPAYRYDAAGRLTKRTWARAIVTDYAYDALGQMTNIAYSDSTPGVAFTYDRLGRQLTIADALGTRTNVYDALALLEERLPTGEVLARTYDAFGRPAGLALNAGYNLAYAYSDVGRLAAITAAVYAVTTAVEYAYLPQSDLLSGWTIRDRAGANPPIGVARTFEPRRDLVASVVNTASVGVVSRFAYVNDPLGRRTAREDEAINVATLTNLFGYNLRSELATAAMGTNAYAFVYDPIGNRQSASQVSGLTSNVSVYAATALNQYASISNSLEPSAFTLQYDADGNLTNSGTWTYVWDAENRLLEAYSNGTLRVQNTYDYMSRRVIKATPTQTNTFLYDAWNMVQESTVSGLQSNVSHYVWGLDLSGTLQGAGGVGGLVARAKHTLSNETATLNSVFAFVSDANGNVSEAINQSMPATRYRYVYGPFGNLVSTLNPGSRDFKFRFSSKYHDDESGLYYYGYRFYSPQLGRWINRDPMGEEGGDNLYAAVQNDVINTFDPLGLDFIAVADRAVQGLGGSAYHYSLQYYESICNPPKGVEMSVSDFLAQNPKARKKGSFELLSDGGWEVWVLRRRGLSPVQTWGVEKVSVSVIHYSDRSDSFASVFSSPNPLVVAYRWAEAMGYAKGYEYAEQEGFAGKFNKWPNSKYQFPGDHPFNNSNTFIRYIVSRLGVRMYELKGAHPGRNSPKAVANLYGKHKPWPAGNIPPSPY